MNNHQATHTAVGTFWSSDQEEIDVNSSTLPFLQHELILNLGDEFSVNNSQANQKLLFSKIQTGIIHTRATGKYSALGILLEPTKAYRMYGLSIAELTAHTSDSPDILLFNKSSELIDKMASVSRSEERLAVLVDFILENSVSQDYPAIVDDFIGVISARNLDNPVEVKKVAKDLDCTSKHLINTFKDVVGITPKKYFQVKQLNLAAKKMWQHPTKKLTTLALESGFYDQSHFIRTFKKFSGLTPSEFRLRQVFGHAEFAHTVLNTG